MLKIFTGLLYFSGKYKTGLTPSPPRLTLPFHLKKTFSFVVITQFNARTKHSLDVLRTLPSPLL